MPDIVKIRDLPAASELAENDYIAVDNPTDGLRRIAMSSIMESIYLHTEDDGNGNITLGIGTNS